MTEAQKMAALLRCERDNRMVGIKYTTASRAAKLLETVDASLADAQAEIARLRRALENLRDSAAEDPFSQKPSERALKSAFSLLDTK